MSNLKEYLENKNCFKLICGAGNKNYDEITKLCAVYSKAGCKFFDVNASVEAVRAAKKGIGFCVPNEEREKYSICISIGAKNDPHTLKCKINPDKCKKCGICSDLCPQKAVHNNLIFADKCIGCKKCIENCQYNAIESYSENIPYEKIIPDIIKEGIDCIEYHAITTDTEEILKTWKYLTEAYNGALSICLDRSKTGNDRIIDLLAQIKKMTPNRLFMVQADGAPMSGGKDDYRTTLQAVAMADIIEKADITPYIILSGGTNTKTIKLAKLNEINISGVAMGSFARKAVKEFTEREDFLTNEKIFSRALSAAKKLIKESLQ